MRRAIRGWLLVLFCCLARAADDAIPTWVTYYGPDNNTTVQFQQYLMQWGNGRTNRQLLWNNQKYELNFARYGSNVGVFRYTYPSTSVPDGSILCYTYWSVSNPFATGASTGIGGTAWTGTNAAVIGSWRPYNLGLSVTGRGWGSYSPVVNQFPPGYADGPVVNLIPQEHPGAWPLKIAETQLYAAWLLLGGLCGGVFMARLFGRT